MQRSIKPSPPAWFSQFFAALFGAFLGLALLKFGNPPIMEKWVSAPADIYEFLLGYPWPISWAYGLFILVALIGLLIARANSGAPRELRHGPLPPRPPSPIPIQLERGVWGERAKKWIIWLPLAWFAWQVLASTQSIDPQLSRPTLKHFAVCVGCFYLGFFSLGRAKPFPFWLGMIGGLLLVLAAGFEQHFGGLEESRRYFFLYVYPKMTEPPPAEYLKKMMSTRIFSTLFYPNALAG